MYSYCSRGSVYLKTDDSTRIYIMALVLVVLVPSVQFILRPTIRHVFTPWHWFLIAIVPSSQFILRPTIQHLLHHGIGSCTAIVPSSQFILRPTIRHVFTPWHWFLYSYCSLISVYLKTDNSTRIYIMALVLVQLLLPQFSLS